MVPRLEEPHLLRAVCPIDMLDIQTIKHILCTAHNSSAGRMIEHPVY
jgi:hypothetical protein